ncbi:hypothetical protein C8J56DRAFT_345857 [Mycena floridula]|nr:hypothetical protein C8J56DRAFT_345857 [Mycena floridula]
MGALDEREHWQCPRQDIRTNPNRTSTEVLVLLFVFPCGIRSHHLPNLQLLVFSRLFAADCPIPSENTIPRRVPHDPSPNTQPLLTTGLSRGLLRRTARYFPNLTNPISCSLCNPAVSFTILCSASGQSWWSNGMLSSIVFHYWFHLRQV